MLPYARNGIVEVIAEGLLDVLLDFLLAVADSREEYGSGYCLCALDSFL